MPADLAKITKNVLSAVERDPQNAASVLRKAVRRSRAAAEHPANRDVAERLLALANRFEEAIPPGDRDIPDPLSLAELEQSPTPPAAVQDFNELENDHEQAVAIESAHGDGDDLDIVARRNLLREARAPQKISINPRVGLYHIGNLATVTYNPSVAQQAAGYLQEAPILAWQGDKEDATTFTIDFDVIGFDPLANPNASYRAYAKLVIGCDGFLSQTIRVDVGNGTRITGAGSYVAVSVGMDAPGPGGNPSVSAVATIGARLGFFAAVSKMPVTTTDYVDGLINGKAVTLKRPKRAVAVSLPYMTQTATALQIDFQDSTGTTVYTRTYTSASAIENVDLTNDIWFLKVTNTSNVGSASFRIPWELSL